MSFWRFFKVSLVLLLGCILLGYFAWQSLESNQAKIAMVIGAAIAYGNALLGFAIISWGFKRSQTKLFLAVFGGIIFRFLLIFAFLFILIGALKASIFTLLASLMLVYFLFLGLEIYQFHKYSDLQRK